MARTRHKVGSKHCKGTLAELGDEIHVPAGHTVAFPSRQCSCNNNFMYTTEQCRAPTISELHRFDSSYNSKQ